MSEPQNRQLAIMIYSSPTYEMQTKAAIPVTMKIGEAAETIILKPDLRVSPADIFREEAEKKLEYVWMEQRYPDWSTVQ